MLEQSQTSVIPGLIHPMEYRQVLADGVAALRPQEDAPATPRVRELEARIRELEDEIQQRSSKVAADLETARTEAREEGRISALNEQAVHIESVGQQITVALTEFAAKRDNYLEQVEQEVVRLALAIAERILHREALMDPLLLAGAVRVALGQLSDTTKVRLIVPTAEQGLWSEMLRLMPNLPLRPDLAADDALSAGECRMETQLGNIDLGVRSQLAEIERGFFDLLEKRDGSAARNKQPEPSCQEQPQSGVDDVDN
ncbi:MAG: FliH/SctL family protein [Acidobacteriaceae bacterium]